MTQLKLKLSGYDIPFLISFFSQPTVKYRWYPEEVAKEISAQSNDQELIDHFKKSNKGLFYRDEILEELIKFSENTKQLH